MQVQSVSNQNFRGLQFHPNYRNVEFILATKLGGIGFNRAMKYLGALNQKQANVNVYLSGKEPKQKICAEVGGKLFKENWLFGPLTVLKRALKTAAKLDLQK